MYTKFSSGEVKFEDKVPCLVEKKSNKDEVQVEDN
jgi:hypothetical protein